MTIVTKVWQKLPQPLRWHVNHAGLSTDGGHVLHGCVVLTHSQISFFWGSIAVLERIRVEDNALIVDGDKIQFTKILAVRVEKQTLLTLLWESLIIAVACASLFWLLPCFKTQAMATLCLTSLLFIAVVLISVTVLKRFALKIKCWREDTQHAHWITLAKSNKLADYLHFQALRHTLMQRLMR